MAQYSDILLDERTNDLKIVNRDLFIIPDTANAILQRLRITLNTFQGEWFLNNKFGTPYYQLIFVKEVTKSQADAVFRDVILNTEGVVSILTFSSTLNSANRAYSVTFSCKVSTGDTLILEI
jgi:hypothetical protein